MDDQMEELCLQMDDMTSFLRDGTKPTTPSKDNEDDVAAVAAANDVSEQISELRRRISELKSTILLRRSTPPRPAPGIPANYSDEEEEVGDMNANLLQADDHEYGETHTITLPVSYSDEEDESIRMEYSTLQIYSIKITDIKGDLSWPLYVYGVLAARDDNYRNILFHRSRETCQKLTPEDPFLRLIGPCRAIAITDHADFDVQLRVKSTTTRAGDRSLISHCYTYYGAYDQGLGTARIENLFCTLEISFDRITNTVEATFVGVRVVGEPFKYGGRIFCSSPPHDELTEPLSRQVVMVDSRDNDDGKMVVSPDGYLHLPRRAVSVDEDNMLKVFVQAYSQSGAIASQGDVSLSSPKVATTQVTMCVRLVTVSWSSPLLGLCDSPSY